MIAGERERRGIHIRALRIGLHQRLDNGLQWHGFVLIRRNDQYVAAREVRRERRQVERIPVFDQLTDQRFTGCSGQHLQRVAIGGKPGLDVLTRRDGIRHDCEVCRGQPRCAGDRVVPRARGQSGEPAHGMPDQNDLVRIAPITACVEANMISG